MIDIATESRMRSKYPFEIDNMALRYKTENNYFTFTSPSLWAIEKHYYFLLKNSVEKEFDQKYKYKPSYMSYDEYGVVNLGYLIMRVNGVFCMEDFDLTSIVIPSMSSIVTVCQDKYPKLDPSKLEAVNW